MVKYSLHSATGKLFNCGYFHRREPLVLHLFSSQNLHYVLREEKPRPRLDQTVIVATVNLFSVISSDQSRKYCLVGYTSALIGYQQV
jgi:hypothetical protein